MGASDGLHSFWLDPELAIAVLSSATVLLTVGFLRDRGRARASVVFAAICLLGCAVVAASRIDSNDRDVRGRAVLAGISTFGKSETERALESDETAFRRVGRPGDDLSDALAAGALGRRPGERLIGVVDRRTALRDGDRPVASDVAIVQELQALSFDPDRFKVRPIARPVIGRPVDLEIVLPVGWPVGAQVSATVGGASIGAERVRPGLWRAAWTPSEAGEASIQIEARAPSMLLRGDGLLDVERSSAPVWVLGDRGDRLVDALRTQDVEVRAFETFPELDEAPSAIVLAARALEVEEQATLADWLDRGTGVFLLGGPEGALPAPGQPLGRPSPFTPLERPPATAGDGESPGDPGSEEPASEDPGPEVPSGDEPRVEPEAPPRDPEQRSDDESKMRGDVSAADLDTILEAEVERRSVGLALVIDGSNSMAQLAGGSVFTKSRLATEAAIQTARALRDGDELGVIAFAGQPRIVVPFDGLGPRQEFERRVRSIRPHGSSFAHFGAELGVDWIVKCDRPVRHVVLLTDGVLERRIADLTAFQAKRAREQGATFSVIQVDSTGQASMLRIAEFGGGQYVAETDGSAIPRLLLAEVQRVLGAAARRENPKGGAGDGTTPGDGSGDPADPSETPESSDPIEDPKTDPVTSEPVEPDPAPESAQPTLEVVPVAPSPLIDPFLDEDLPRLFAADPVEARAEADQLLAVFPDGASNGAPLLGFANRGLGRIGAFASDLPESWWNDERLPALLATWVQATSPVTVTDSSPPELELARSWSPSLPTAAEFERRTALGLGPPSQPDSVPVVPDLVVSESSPRDADDALLLLGLLVLLVVGERALRR